MTNDEKIVREKLCKAELEIMDNIVNACEELHLKYVICAGTLLGAVRHEGFIPWDDDIDIAMPREDYEVFIAKASKYMDSKLFIQNYLTEPNTNALWTKVRNTRTIFFENDNKDFDMCHGIFVDIFPLDRIKKGRLSSEIEFIKRYKFNLVAGCYCEPYYKGIRHPIKKILAYFIRNTIYLRTPIHEWLKKEDERRRAMNQKGDNCYPIHFFENKGSLTYEELFDDMLFNFEDRKYRGPKEYDLYLRKMYGDNYMQLPPEGKRITHRPLKIEFEDKD